MATTGSRAGFRLPWNSEERDTTERDHEPRDADGQSRDDAPTSTPDWSTDPAPVAVEATTGDTVAQATDQATDQAADQAAERETAARVTETWLTPTMVSPASPSPVQTGQQPPEWAGTTGEDALVFMPARDPNRTAGVPARKPTKFLADLTRAMQTAAEAARSSTLDQLQIECKAHIERVNARSAEHAAGLRTRADADIVAIREWSKAEIARIREETDGRVGGRKSSLEGELTVHAEETESEIGHAQATVMEFEAEMAQFFERLFREEDPAEFAALAEHLPEPPDFGQTDSSVRTLGVAPAAALNGRATVAAISAILPASGPIESAASAPPAASEAAVASVTAEPEAPVEPVMAELPTANPTMPDQVNEGRYIDPRLTALGLTADFDSAEAEAAADAADRSHDTEQEIPTISDDALAARLAGLIPERLSPIPEGEAQETSAASSQVVVTGLVSVASIAGFKRQLGRLVGIRSVGVSSGPDGEFVFTVSHDPELKPADLVPLLTGFEARVTGAAEGIVHVAARDPESEA